MPEPFGYGAYKTLMNLRRGKKAALLGIEAYRTSPLKAFESVLGLKSVGLKEQLEKSGEEIRKVRRLFK